MYKGFPNWCVCGSLIEGVLGGNSTVCFFGPLSAERNTNVFCSV